MDAGVWRLPDNDSEISNASPVADPQSLNPPRHDVLEVNDYLTKGLVNSEIDAWFCDGVPIFSPQDLGVPQDNQNLSAAIKRARSALCDPSQTAWAHVRPQCRIWLWSLIMCAIS